MIRLSYALVRLLAFFLLNHVGRIILGCLLLPGGIIYGLTSHPITYQQAPQDHYHVYELEGGSIYYLQLQGTQTYYIINAASGFTSFPDETPLQDDTKITSLIYNSNAEKVDVDLTSELDLPAGHLSGTGYKVVQFAVADANNKAEQTFATREYQQYPQGHYESHWLEGGIAAAAGLLVLLFTFALRAYANWLDKRQEAREQAAIKEY